MRKHLLIITFALTTTFLQAQIVNIPDTNFKAALLKKFPKIDTNNNGEIETNEASIVKKLLIVVSKIKDLKGIEAFTSLDTLDIESNEVTTLDLSKNTSLKHFNCTNNKLITLDLTNNVNLVTVFCFKNRLTDINVSKCTSLVRMECHYNNLQKLDLRNNSALKSLDVSYNLLESINLSFNKNLEGLLITNNNLTSLDITKNTALKGLICDTNQLTTLDLRNNNALNIFYSRSNLSLSTICINDNQVVKTSTWYKDATSEYSTNCTLTNIEQNELMFSNNKLIRIFSSLGQELQPEQVNEGLFIYQYSDGSTKKIMKTE